MVFLLRENPTQAVAGAVFGISQSTVSRRFEALHAIIGEVLADLAPDPAVWTRGSTGRRDTGADLGLALPRRPVLRQAPRHRVQPADRHHPGGDLLAVGAPVPGSRHDTHAWHACGLASTLADLPTLADLGYLGTEAVTGTRTPPGGELSADRKAANTALSAIRAVVEHAISWLKNWKILGGRCRAPLNKYHAIVKTVTALHFLKFNHHSQNPNE